MLIPSLTYPDLSDLCFVSHFVKTYAGHEPRPVCKDGLATSDLPKPPLCWGAQPRRPAGRAAAVHRGLATAHTAGVAAAGAEPAPTQAAPEAAQAPSVGAEQA